MFAILCLTAVAMLCFGASVVPLPALAELGPGDD